MKYWLACIVLTTSCSANLTLDPSTVVDCTRDSDCPNGLVCLNQTRCAASGSSDSRGATLATPSEGDIFDVRDTIVFAWSQIPSAIVYKLQVATDPSFGSLVIDLPTEVTSHTTTLPSGTYYWRVIADITTTGAELAVNRFGVVDDAIYVYCDGACDANDAELGTIGAPFRSISRALNAAVSRGVANVRIATRPSGMAYEEALQLRNGVSLTGGYTADFATRSGRSAIAFSDTALYGAFVSLPTRVEHLAFSTTGDTGAPVATFYRCSAALVMEDVGFDAPMWSGDVVRFREGAGDAGPLLADCDVTGALPAGGPSIGELNLIATEGTSLTIIDSRLRGSIKRDLGISTNETSGIFASSGSITTRSVDIALSATSVVADVRGIAIAADTELDAEATSVAIDAPQASIGRAIHLAQRAGATVVASNLDVVARGPTGINLLDDATLSLHRSRVTSRLVATGTFSTRGISAQARNQLLITSSLVRAIGRGQVTALFAASSPRGLVAQSTFSVADGSTMYAVEAFDALLGFVNNAFVAETTCAGFCRVGMSLASAEPYYYLIALANNAFVGFGSSLATGCAYSPGNEDCVDPNGPTSQTSVTIPYRAGNVVVPVLADARLTNLRPAAGSPLAGKGIDPSLDVCRQDGSINENFVPVPPSCGGIATDIASDPLTTPPVIGAFNAVP